MFHRSGGGMLVTMVVVAAISSAQAQEAANKADVPVAAVQSPEYRVGPGDRLALQVFGLAELSQTMRVSNSGRVHVAYVGTLSVVNLTVAQIEDEIARRLREQQLVNDPWVRIQVVEYRSQPVFIVGEVHSPGQYMITGEMRLLDAVSKAGGFTNAAGTNGFLMRRHDFAGAMAEIRAGERSWETMRDRDLQASETPAAGSGTATEGGAPARDRITINISDLKAGIRPELNVLLQGGDVFYVPARRTQYLYIVGEVALPGAYILPQSYDHITAARAVSYAGGPLRTAKTSKGFIMRYDRAGAYQAVPFDFAAVARGREPDIPISPGDILFVPRSVGKTIGYNLLALMPGHLLRMIIW
ncbi:MAG: polysaccharide biosynthesis/export family protein [Acidobacteria bacterium]|nr:polysaccharide biosynthesis/export family protein [Acidobacteriota bacterium]